MSQKSIKKIRQYYRRDLRKKLGLETLLLKRLLKKKPRLFPGFLWKLGARIYFNKVYYDRI